MSGITNAEKRAVGLYAVLDRDACDFMDMLEESEPKVIQVLYEMLTCKDGGPDTDYELNKIGADIVKGNAARRGISIKSWMEKHGKEWEAKVKKERKEEIKGQIKRLEEEFKEL
jgi:hypothetical protein